MSHLTFRYLRNSLLSTTSFNPFASIALPLKAILILFTIFFCSLSYSQPLRVGTTLWPGYEPLYLAQEIKAYKRDIRMIHYPSTSDVMRAFKNKALEAAALTLDEVVMFSEYDIPIEIILVLDTSKGADVIMGRPELKEIQGLIGAKIAVESTAVGAYTLSRALEIHNIDINQVELLNSEQSNHIENYRNGLVDAVVSYEPVRTQLLNLGAIELFSSKEIPDEILDVLVVHKDVLKTNTDAIYDIIRGWFEALDYLKTDTVKSYQFISSRMKISTKNVKECYKGLALPSLKENKALLKGNPSLLEQSMTRLSDHMVKAGLVKPKNSNNITITTHYLP